MLKIKINFGFLKYLVLIVILFTVGLPLVFANESEIPSNYLKKIEFKDSIYKEIFDSHKHPEFFKKYTKYYYNNQEIRFASGSTLSDYLAFNFQLEERSSWGMDQGAVLAFIEKELVPKYNRVPQNVRIFRENNQIKFEGVAVQGREIDKTKLIYLFSEAFTKENIDAILLPFVYTEPEINVEDETLVKQGIKDLLATGESDFSGSSWMRITNVRIGLSRFNGIVIPQGEVFSIGANLGEVSARTGYKKELVIKGDRTIPEYGGGLCQVSTTSFRGALLAGFEIVERWPHAYAVTYYEPYGTDSTIYFPLKDLKFRNNTRGAVLIQTFIDEPNHKAYFKYYGTKDKRDVKIIGPYLSNYRSPGATKYEVNPNLKAGETKILGSAHKGFDAFWYREVFLNKTSSGQTIFSGAILDAMSGASLVDKIFSRYKPTAWFYQVSASN